MAKSALFRPMLLGLWIGLLMGGVDLWAQTKSRSELEAMPAPQLYQRACAPCHGPDGRGYPHGEWRKRTGLLVPPPDFTDPKFSATEPLADWIAVIRDGGAQYGLSSQMPAFGAALSEEKIRELALYLKSLGADPRYPPGELSFPRALRTAKAFPEDELLLIPTYYRREAARRFAQTLYYARRFGPSCQIEVKATPVWTTGESVHGEIEFGLKRVFHTDLNRQLIATLGIEAAFPVRTSEPWTLTPYLAFGQGLGDAFSLQTSLHLGWSAGPSMSFHLRWSGIVHWMPLQMPYWVAPAIEWTVERTLRAGEPWTAWLAPQVFITLARRGHVALAIGPEFPLTRGTGERYRIRALLLWEYPDGPFWEGW